MAHDAIAGQAAEPGVFGVGGDPAEVTELPLALQAALVGHVLPVHPGDNAASGQSGRGGRGCTHHPHSPTHPQGSLGHH